MTEMSDDEFDAFYGKGMFAMIQGIINDLAPVTRRDDWWGTGGPYEIIATHLMKPHPDDNA